MVLESIESWKERLCGLKPSRAAAGSRSLFSPHPCCTPPPRFSSKKGPTASAASPPLTNLKLEPPQTFEQSVAADPDDLEARGRLLVGYVQSNNGAGLAKELAWLVENHPESELHDTYAAYISRARIVIPDASALAQIDNLWRKQAAANPSSPTILRHAARYLFDADPTAALDFLKTARLVAPADPEVIRATVDSYSILALTRIGRRNTAAWLEAADQAIGQLESSSDAALLGAVGTALSKFKLRLGPSTPPQSVEAARVRTAGVRDLALKLLDRAIALQPANQDWKTARLAAQNADTVAVQTPPPSSPAPEPEPAPRSQTEMPRRITVGGNVQQAMLVTAPPS